MSVLLVLLYHAGFSWMSGGFFGVEVFFVVSGFLITTLLISEHDRSGRISFRGFWARRARRLFPALGAVLLAVMLWTAIWGTAEQVSQVRRDVPWAVFYLSNWGQILGDIPYFTADPPILRHLWSLGVEEQWYVVWPVVVIGLLALGRSRRLLAGGVAVAAAGVMVFTAWMESGSPSVLGGPPPLFEGVDRTNFMYLSTVTRTSGLLLGAAAAFVWQSGGAVAVRKVPARLADMIGGVALVVVGAASVFAVITEGYVYRWLLPMVSVSSLAVVVVAVGSERSVVRAVLSQRPLVEVGVRSYGLYLWSWPVFVVAGAIDGSVGRFVIAMLLSVVVTELSYRFLEMPVRRGALTTAWRKHRPAVATAGLAVAAATVGLVAWYASTEEYNPLARGEAAVFDTDEALGEDPVTGAANDDEVPGPADDADEVSPGALGQSVQPTANVVVLGDSQAGALVVNAPEGIGELFPNLRDGSLEGCSVWDSGAVRSEVENNSGFDRCAGWQQDWADAAVGSDVALVTLGAWDVFDKVDRDRVIVFGSPFFDAEYTERLRSGVDAVLASGVPVALLEVPCMRPIDVPVENGLALPERGDDERVAHLNSLIADVADSYDDTVQVVEGPDWCGQEILATDGDLRWDGVHYVPEGSALVFETIAADLLRMASR